MTYSSHVCDTKQASQRLFFQRWKKNVKYEKSPKTGISDKCLRRYKLTHVNFHFIPLKIRERIFPLISFLEVGVKVKKKSCITLLRSFELQCSMKPAHECPFIVWDKVDTVITRQYSAICSVKYYKDLYLRFVFCTEKAMLP